jgi:hypothetical protein
MLSKPHRKFCEEIVSGLPGVRAYALAYPSCSLKTARFNASHLRAKPHIQQEIARLRAQADAIVGPTVLTLIEKRLWLARVVRANLAFLDPETDGDLLVSLHIEEGRKQARVSRMRIANKLAAIRLDSRLAGDEPAKSKPSTSTYAEKLLAAGGTRIAGGLVVPFEHRAWVRVPPTVPPKPSPDTQSSEASQASPASPFDPRPSTFDLSPASSDASADSQPSVDSQAAANHHESANSESSTDSQDIPPEAPDSTFDPRPSSFDPCAPSPATSDEPPIDSGYIAPVFPPPRPRFNPGPDYAARQRAKRRQPVVRHLWDQH